MAGSRRTIFDSKLYKRATDSTGLYRVKIGNIVGILKNQVNLSMAANFETLLSLDSKFSTARKVLGISGNNIFTTGIFTRKFFRSGGYVVIPIEFRVVDWEGTGNVLRDAVDIYQSTVPKGRGKLAKTDISRVSTAFKKTLVEGFKLGTGKQTIEQTVNNIQTGGLGDSAPQPVPVEISTYFKMSRMIITSVSGVFSKEVTPQGPLFADFSVTVESEQAVTQAEMANILRNTPVRSRRVQVVDKAKRFIGDKASEVTKGLL